MTYQELGPDNAMYIGDGEWMSWDEVDHHYQLHLFREEFPGADPHLVGVFMDLLATAEGYFELTGRHLQVYGDIGELYGAIAFGLKLNRIYAQGSDGRIGNDHVEVKTITPFKSGDFVELNMARNFNKVLVVKIGADFSVSAKMFDRKDLPRSKNAKVKLTWCED